MITLYAWNTPNGQKPAILLEELGVEYTLRGVNIGSGEQFEPWFVEINPNSKIPALVHEEAGAAPVRLFESGALLIYLAERFGGFLPEAPAARAAALSWTFWQVGGVGPMLGQWGHFAGRGEGSAYALERFSTESLRLLGVLERQLGEHAWAAGEAYSVADIALWPWVYAGRRYLRAAGAELPSLPSTEGWCERIGARPAVQRAMSRLEGLKSGG